jgi:hypothetical protein
MTYRLAFPNSQGLSVRNNLLDTPPKLKIEGLQLVRSGALGRILAFDPDYYYLITTVSTLLRYHDITFVSRFICYLAVENGNVKLNASSVCD